MAKESMETPNISFLIQALFAAVSIYNLLSSPSIASEKYNKNHAGKYNATKNEEQELSFAVY